MRPGLGGIRAPRRGVGADFAGVVEQVGSQVRAVTTGDEVDGCADGAFTVPVRSPTPNSIPHPPVGVGYVLAIALSGVPWPLLPRRGRGAYPTQSPALRIPAC
jgi:NADPH:quinone reductase-like Zn-dependent oxidoreductase